MSAFINKPDYDAHIHQYKLDSLTAYNDNLLPTVETRAVDFIKGYLHPRYNISVEFGKTGSERNPTLLACAIDMAIYFLAKQLKPREIPDIIIDTYDEWVAWLKDVQAGTVNPPDLTKNTTDGNFIEYGSNTKRGSYI